MDKDKMEIAEYISAISFLLVSIVLFFFGFPSPDMKSPEFWASVSAVLSILQLLGILTGLKLIYTRICMAWVCGSIWTWLAIISLNSILAIPALCIGFANLFAFMVLVNKCKFNWINYFHNNIIK